MTLIAAAAGTPSSPPRTSVDLEADEDREDRHDRVQVDRAADDDRHHELVLDLADHDVDEDHDAGRREAALHDRVGRGDARGDDRPDERDDLEEAGQDRDRERIAQAHDRPEDDVHDRSDEHDEQQLAAQPAAQDRVDLGEERHGPRPVLGREQAHRDVAEPGAVNEEVERHDEREGRLEDRLADGPRDVDRVARPDQVGQGVLDLGRHRGHGDRLAPEHDRVAAHELAEGRREGVGAAPREELELTHGLAGEQVAGDAERAERDDVADGHDDRPRPAEAPLGGRDERAERVGDDRRHDERPEDRAPDPGHDEDGDDEDAERPHGRAADGVADGSSVCVSGGTSRARTAPRLSRGQAVPGSESRCSWRAGRGAGRTAEVAYRPRRMTARRRARSARSTCGR